MRATRASAATTYAMDSATRTQGAVERNQRKKDERAGERVVWK